MRYEPLATYLEPHFGNVYEDGETWTPELQDAVTAFLVHEVTDDVYRAFVRELDFVLAEGPRKEDATFIVEHGWPWEIAYAFHIAAVKAAPTLRDVVGDGSTWKLEDQKEDATFWLDGHATYEQLHNMACLINVSLVDIPFILPDKQSYPSALDDRHLDVFFDLAKRLPNVVAPQRLLRAWKEVAGPSPTDLTDKEWALLYPFLPKGRKASTPNVVRQAINGMLWRHMNPNITPIPARYGGTPINLRKSSYKHTGVFTRMLAGLAGEPEAERLVAWLREVTRVGVPVEPVSGSTPAAKAIRN